MGYAHSKEFLLAESKAVLAERWRIAREDAASGVLETEWKVSLSPMASSTTGFGRRQRLVVRIVDAEEGRRKVEVTEETERNTNDLAPSDPEAAEWEPMETDGVVASTFLTRLHHRLNPPERWRRDQSGEGVR